MTLMEKDKKELIKYNIERVSIAPSGPQTWRKSEKIEVHLSGLFK